jgi:hypothetical protein
VRLTPLAGRTIWRPSAGGIGWEGRALTYAEISSIVRESFDWNAPSVTVAACYTKNGQTATLPLPNDLLNDLKAYVDTIEPGKRVFPLPNGKGARLIRRDLKAAGIPYRDASGLVFDFHSLRCELATLADSAGVSPRVVQKLMRHSTLELTGRYTKLRSVDIEAGVSRLPSLKPDEPQSERTTITRTGSKPVCIPSATQNATKETAYDCNYNADKVFTSTKQRSAKPSSPLRIRAAPF